MIPPADNETFGSRIRRLRHEAGLTQRRLAAEVGIDFTYLSKLENDQDGQSPGDALVRNLARRLDDDAEDLLALAGKVPVDALRSSARQDARFARSLRRLFAPPAEMVAIGDVSILATLTSSTRPGGQAGPQRAVTCAYRSDFEAQQDEYLVGLVGDQTHCDRLRDANVPIHDILLVDSEQLRVSMSVAELVARHHISVRYRDNGDADYVRAELERIADTAAIWQPRVSADRFPLVILRARFPATTADHPHRIELGYQFDIGEGDEGYWFWSASRPSFVSTITIDATDLERYSEVRLVTFLPNVEWVDERDGMHVIQVSNWVVRGHGVSLSWWAAGSKPRREPEAAATR